ncbi:MAG: domain S-box protein, partial [Herminiimonas sp.]|nr:domain S-box protein [Herminiimonas sp.]
VEDDGKGIDTERLLDQESWGVLGMYERARHFGCELRITGIPGKGTIVLLRLPLENPDLKKPAASVQSD